MVSTQGPAGSRPPDAGGEVETFAIRLGEVFCPCCEDDLAAAIRHLPHVVDARLGR